MSFLKKIQSQPPHIRKIILWSIMIVLGLALAFLWIRIIYVEVREFQKEEFIEGLNLPALNEELKELPKIEMPEIPQENGE